MEWEELKQFIKKWLRWYRSQRAVKWGLRGLALGLGIALIDAVMLIVLRLLIGLEYVELVWFCAFIGLVLGLTGGYIWPINMGKLIHLFDYTFGLQERVSTALELHHLVDKKHPGQAFIAGGLPNLQLSDTLVAVRQVKPNKVKPFRLERWALLCVYALGFLLIVVWVQSQDQFLVAQQKRQTVQSINSEKEHIQAQINEIQQSNDLSQIQKEVLSNPLKEALNQLQKAQTPEQAVAIASQAEQVLSAFSSPVYNMQAEALQNTADQIGTSKNSPLRETSLALSTGNFSKAGETLKKINVNGLSTDQRQTMISELNEAGQNIRNSNPQVGKNFQEVAKALQQGNDQIAQQYLQEAAKSLGQSGQQFSQSLYAQKAVDQLHQNQVITDRLVEPTSVKQNGQEKSTAQNNQTGGVNAQNNTSIPLKMYQSNGDAKPGGNATVPNNSSDSGIGITNEKVYSPSQQVDQNGVPLDISGNQPPGSQVVGQQSSSNSGSDQSQVPYVNVISSYSETYRKAMQNGEVPIYLQPVIRNYFSSLEQ